MSQFDTPTLDASAALPAVDSHAPAQLRRNYLSLPELIAQSIGLVGAAGGAGLLVPAVFANAGNGTWLAYLFATGALLFASWSLTQFAKRAASPGALYLYAARGLGPIWGVIAGWALLIAYGVGAAGILQGTAHEVLVFLRDAGIVGGAASLTLNLAVLAAVSLGAWFIAYRDIRLSTRATLLIELVTVALIVVVLVVALTAHHRWVDPAQATLAGVKPEQIRLGMVLAFFSFTGFESVTALGSEAKEPLRLIPRALILSILGPAVFFLFVAWAMVSAFQGAATPLDQANAPLSLIAHGVGLGAAGVLIDAGVALSFFAAFFSSVNAAARLLYTFARQGLVHEKTGRAHAANATPHVAVTLWVGASFAAALATQWLGATLFDAYGYLSTVATYGYLIAYVLVALAAPIYLRRLGELKPVHWLLSAVSVVLLAVPLVGSVYPVVPGVYAWLPWVFVGLVAIGLGWFLGLRLLAPQRLRDIEDIVTGDAVRP